MKHADPTQSPTLVHRARTFILRSGQLRLLALSVSLAALLATGLCMPERAQAQAISNSSLYYRLGGTSPFGGTLNRSLVPTHMGLSMRLNYSCGKFDLGSSWTNLMNQVSQLGGVVDSAIQGAIAALPLYILQRAEPGLYQLFTQFSAKADLLIAAAMKNCQQMEAQIKSGKDPYEDFINVAKGVQWKEQINAGGDIIHAQSSIETNEAGQNNGAPWIFGVKAGGLNQSSIQPINDLTIAGYQILCNTVPSLNTANSSTCPSTALISQIFATPQAMATWSTQVLGDRIIYTCSQSDSGCPQQSATTSNAGTTASGLGPKLQDEINAITPILQQVLADPSQSAQLAQISTPGFAISGQLIESIRRMPADEQPDVLTRFANELAMHRVVNKALAVRSALLAGLSIPEAAKAAQTQKDVQEQIDHLTHYLDDLLYEWRIRKEMTSVTATTVMRESAYQDSLGVLQRQATPADTAPLINGAVPITAP
jgi:integrating conjugative element protein (TIGR03755 family)